MRIVFLSLLLASAASLAAQAPARQSSASLVLPSSSESCPVDFGATLNTQLVIRSIQDGAKSPANSASLDLTFDPHAGTARIVSAEVVVRGFSAATRYLPAATGADTIPDRSQTFDLAPRNRVTGLTRTEVSVTRVPLVRWAEITDLRFADGSSWHASQTSRCRATPSGFHLVDAASR